MALFIPANGRNLFTFWLLSQKCSDGFRLRENKAWNLLGDVTSLHIEEAGLADTLTKFPVASTEIRKDFSSVQI